MKPVNAVQIIREAFATYRDHAATVLTVSLLINGVGLVASIVAMNALGMVGIAVFLMIALATQQVSNGAFASLMSSRWAGDDLSSAQDVIRPALARIGALCVAAVLFSFGVGIAALFFVLPAIYLATRWAVVFPAIVIGRQRATEAFGQSSQYTSQAMDTTFAVVLFNFLLGVLAPRLITGSAGGDMAPMETSIIASFAISTVLGPISGLAVAELYLRLAPPVTAGGPTVGRGAFVPVAQQPVAGGSGAWVPMPAGAAQPAMAAAPYGVTAAAPAAYGAPAHAPQPYGAAPHAPQPYGAPGQAPAAYGAPSGYGAPQPYGAPAQAHSAPAAYGAPQPYAAPAQAHGAPAAYGAPQPYGAPAQAHAAQAGYPAGAPQQAPPAYAQQPGGYGTPASPGAGAYAAPAPPAAPAYGHAQPPAAYGAPPLAAPAAPPAHPGAAPAAYAPAPTLAPPLASGPTYGAPPVAGAMPPGGSPAAPPHPAREQSVAPPGLG